MSRTAQTQTARPVARAAATRRTAVAPSKTAFSSRFAAKGQTIFCIDAESRPRYGQALFTHTVAALQALGMLRPGQPAVSKAALTALIGERAVKYHAQEENLTITADRVRLTAPGALGFRARVTDGDIDISLANAFVGLFLDGSTTGVDVPKSKIRSLVF